MRDYSNMTGVILQELNTGALFVPSPLRSPLADVSLGALSARVATATCGVEDTDVCFLVLGHWWCSAFQECRYTGKRTDGHHPLRTSYGWFITNLSED
jgi:hypothetical protein